MTAVPKKGTRRSAVSRLSLLRRCDDTYVAASIFIQRLVCVQAQSVAFNTSAGRVYCRSAFVNNDHPLPQIHPATV